MTKGQKIATFVGLGVVAVGGVLAKIFTSDDFAAMTTDTSSNQAVPNTPVVVPEGGKKVTATESYKNPGGSDQVGFTIAVDKDGTITGAETQVMAENRTSKMYQQKFSQALPTMITGKKLSDLTSIDRTGGASLTTGAFNLALTKLKSEL